MLLVNYYNSSTNTFFFFYLIWRYQKKKIITRYTHAQESLTLSVSMAGKHRRGEEVSEEDSEVVHPPPNAKVEGVVRMLSPMKKVRLSASRHSGLSYLIGPWPQDGHKPTDPSHSPTYSNNCQWRCREGTLHASGYFGCVVKCISV